MEVESIPKAETHPDRPVKVTRLVHVTVVAVALGVMYRDAPQVYKILGFTRSMISTEVKRKTGV